MRRNKNIIIFSLVATALVAGAAFLHIATPSAPAGTTQAGPTAQSTSTASAPQADQAEPDSTPSAARGKTTTQSTRRATTPTPLRAAPNAPKQDEIAKSITREYPYRALLVPNDPAASNPQFNWVHTKTNTTGAWNTTTGSPVVIAIIDTGFALQHEDLATQWHQNSGETGLTATGDRCWTGTPADKPTNNCDDDNNGYTDDWRGWNFYGRYAPSSTPCTTPGTYVANNNPQAGSAGDDIYYAEQQACTNTSTGDPFGAVSHGTSTAGLAGAATNNGKGIASANWSAEIMPLQALGDDGSGWTSDVVSAIHYAVDNGAAIISMSLGGPALDPSLQSAIAYAYSHNVVVVAASGNCGTGLESGCDSNAPGAMSYPARFDHVISVGAINDADTWASFSSYGPALDVVAPGAGALSSTLIDRGTGTPNSPASFNYTSAYANQLYGTSFSTPIVAGIASLIRSVKPTTSVDDVTALIDGTARKVPGMNGSFYSPQYGHGVIDADALTSIAKALASTSDTPKLSQTGDYRSEHFFTSNGTISSGCAVSAYTYCTVRAQNIATGADRYLPYARAGAAGTTGWSWPGAALNSGAWTLRAVQGINYSYDYPLFNK